MRIDVKRKLPLSPDELNKILYQDDEEEYGCFIDRKHINSKFIPQNYPRHAKLGELIKIGDSSDKPKILSKK